LPELLEASARTGNSRIADDALDRLARTTRAGGTDLGLGIEARSRALLNEGEIAEGHYREAIGRLGRARRRPELARTHLLYGEWLRRQRRRGEAREQLRTAYQMLHATGMDGFAERARRELLAAGETVGKRTAQPARAGRSETSEPLTAQEAQVARLARDGLSNPGDRSPAVHQRAYRPVPPEQGLHQARYQLPRPAAPGSARGAAFIAYMRTCRQMPTSVVK
jgi:ATP/maltotriose-dependent transcriptional regulator MalT